MAIFGGFMTIVSILGFFLTVIWFILPFVIFSIKGRVDRSVELLEDIDRRLAALEARSRSIDEARTDSPQGSIPAEPIPEGTGPQEPAPERTPE